MKYMLDTNICIYLIKKAPKKILDRFMYLELGDLCISSITLAELEYGVAKSQNTNKNQTALEQFLIPLDVFPFNDIAAKFYGNVRSVLEKKGQAIGSMNYMIGAHALSLDTTLVTNNTKEFKKIPKLKVENWA